MMNQNKSGVKALLKIAFNYRYALLLIALVLVFVPFFPFPEKEASNTVFFLGRFHPLIVHFPIVLVFLALIFELLARIKWLKLTKTVQATLLGSGLFGSLVSLVMGLLLYATGEYSGDLVTRHLWGGVLLAITFCLACFFFLEHVFSNRKVHFISYLSLLVVANVALFYTSHQGGSLTHGADYLTEYMPVLGSPDEEEYEPKPMEEMLVYEDMIIPFLDKKCMSCHNTNKSKGGLVMTSYEAMLKGGKSGKATLKPGDHHESELIQRVVLPSDHDDHMPPEGKAPLSPEEISILEWWVREGADTDLKLEAAKEDPSIQSFIVEYLQDLEKQQRAKFMQEQALESMIVQVSNDKKFQLGMDKYGDGKIALSMAFPPSSFEDNDLTSLQPLFGQISKASLVASGISDDALYHIGQMDALKELYLQQTAIDGSGLVYLASLPNLQLLNLSKTNVNDGNLLHILRMEKLEELYLNDTEVSLEVIEAIKKNKPNLKVALERGNFF
ncbi:c-type cytochrome domain-containing protein [Pleomorphovibrio marinus]|uniref:c-type cytochrome domain-containing protein n=1 Tax=Pleomorphovibrio marinus TaxID=2164132 RepID=UPI000E0B21E9|nr:c-type cytochrome domain-containing protein [Pleomorphovibrio marinus]